MSSAEMSAEIGVSRATAQRYLSTLSNAGDVKIQLRYGTTGRPEQEFVAVEKPPPPAPPRGRASVGVGEAVMDAVMTWSESKGCRGIDGFALPGDRETQNFFERFGLTARAILVHRSLLPAEEASAAEA